MTRFARAKGSKASNERVPEDATSWQEMKQQLEDKKREAETEKKRKEAEETRRGNYAKFLDELEDGKEESWAEFEGNAKPTGKKVKINGAKKVKKPDVRMQKEAGSNGPKRKEKGMNGPKRKGNKSCNKKENPNKQKETPNSSKQIQKVKKPYAELTDEEKKKVDKKREKRAKQIEKRKQIKSEQTNQTDPRGNDESPSEPKSSFTSETRKRKPAKIRDGKEHKRRKPDSQQTSMNINGVEVKISYVDGFPVKSEDASRLQQLRKQMISKGIPRSEIKAALKLERRKAEKALAREKKKVCFNCRKSGHVLSECPSLNENADQETIGSGVCFKCGSTEHTHFECKVVRADSYKFATCFICKEQGHISRQCPDNNKGLYPKGGACKVCGDVTHLKKDCPKYQAQQEALNIQVDSLRFDNVENLDDKGNSDVIKDKPNKIIRF